MLTVVPRGAFRNGFDLVDDAGRTLGGFAGSVWREGGEIVVGAERWEFRRQRGRRFELAGPQGTYAVAERRSMWTGDWHVAAGDRLYHLARPSRWSRRYDVRVGDTVVGGLSPQGVFSDKADVSLPTEMPPPIQVFVIAVVMTQWRRDSAASTAAVSAS